jgi:hypothetical protein
MPRIPRKLLIDPTEPGVFHCISRCVRNAFLSGEDPFTGRNYDYRRQWIQDRLEFLAGQFGIDLLGFAGADGATHEWRLSWTVRDLHIRPIRLNGYEQPHPAPDGKLRRIGRTPATRAADRAAPIVGNPGRISK